MFREGVDVSRSLKEEEQEEVVSLYTPDVDSSMPRNSGASDPLAWSGHISKYSLCQLARR